MDTQNAAVDVHVVDVDLDVAVDDAPEEEGPGTAVGDALHVAVGYAVGFAVALDVLDAAVDDQCVVYDDPVLAAADEGDVQGVERSDAVAVVAGASDVRAVLQDNDAQIARPVETVVVASAAAAPVDVVVEEVSLTEMFAAVVLDVVAEEACSSLLIVAVVAVKAYSFLL